MSHLNLVNIVGGVPIAHKKYGNHKARSASLHIKTGGKSFHFDYLDKNNPHIEDWGKQKINKKKKGKKNGDIYEQRKKRNIINFI